LVSCLENDASVQTKKLLKRSSTFRHIQLINTTFEKILQPVERENFYWSAFHFLTYPFFTSSKKILFKLIEEKTFEKKK